MRQLIKRIAFRLFCWPELKSLEEFVRKDQPHAEKEARNG
jgi:hypothetical protein